MFESSQEHAAMARVVEAHYESVLAYCRRHAPAHADAEDLAQEAFLRFVRNGRHYRDEGKPLAYLLVIARNLCADAARSRLSLQVPLDEATDPPDDAAQEGFGAVDDAGGGVAVALAALPADLREAVELRYGQDLAVGEVACVLGISRFAAMRRIKKALSLLEGMLEDSMDEREV